MSAIASSSRRVIRQIRSIARPTASCFSTFPSVLAAAKSTPASPAKHSDEPAAPKLSSKSTSKKGAKKQMLSSCLPGTTLTGLSVLKDQPDPVAKLDEEYPSWLWTLLDSGKASDLVVEGRGKPSYGDGEGLDFVSERKKLKAANKAKIKAKNLLKAN